MRSSIFTRLCTWRALDALARKRSTKRSTSARFCACSRCSASALSMRPRALFEVLVVGAGVERESAAGELGDAVHVAAQEGAVVRDHDDRAAVAVEKALEPLDRGQVEVVGGLVEQQHVGLGEQQLRQLDAHPPAAGEARERARAILLCEAEAREHARHARLALEAAAGCEARAQLVLALGEGFGGILAARARASRSRPRSRDSSRSSSSRCASAGRDLLARRCAARRGRSPGAGGRRAVPRGSSRRPASGASSPASDAQQRGLARAVRADQPDPVARAHVERHALEERATGNLPRDILGSQQHGGNLGQWAVKARWGGADTKLRTTRPSRSDG